MKATREKVKRRIGDLNRDLDDDNGVYLPAIVDLSVLPCPHVFGSLKKIRVAIFTPHFSKNVPQF